MSLETGIAFEFFKYIPGSFTHHTLSGMYFHEQKANISTDEISKAEQLAASTLLLWHICVQSLTQTQLRYVQKSEANRLDA